MAESDLLVEIARFIERVAATARTGLAFKPDGYDSERYEEMLHEASRLSAAVAGGHLVYTGGPEGLASGKLQNELIFLQLGEQRFLTAVWINNQGLSVPKSKEQKKLEKSGAVGEEVKIVIK